MITATLSKFRQILGRRGGRPQARRLQVTVAAACDDVGATVSLHFTDREADESARLTLDLDSAYRLRNRLNHALGFIAQQLPLDSLAASKAAGVD